VCLSCSVVRIDRKEGQDLIWLLSFSLDKEWARVMEKLIYVWVHGVERERKTEAACLKRKALQQPWWWPPWFRSPAPT
jgi:hypothetical protein